MSKSIKILSALLVVIMLVSAVNVVFAAEVKPSQVSPKYDGQDTAKLTSLAGSILGWVRNIAAVISVVLIAILGVKFMIGSTEERAEYKKSFLPLIIGIVVVLSATVLADWIWGIANI